MSEHSRDDDDFQDAVDDIPVQSVDEVMKSLGLDEGPPSPSKKKKKNKKKNKKKGSQTDSVAADTVTTPAQPTEVSETASTLEESDKAAQIPQEPGVAAAANAEAASGENDGGDADAAPSAPSANGPEETTATTMESADADGAVPDETPVDKVTEENRAEHEAEEVAPQDQEDANEKEDNDDDNDPLDDFTERFDVSDQDLKDSNKSLEEKLNMLQLDTENGVGESGDEPVVEPPAQTLSSPLAVETSTLPEPAVEPDTSTQSSIPEPPITSSTTMKPELPPREHTAIPALPPRENTAAPPPQLPQRRKAPISPIAVNQTPPTPPERKNADLLKAAASLTPPPLPPQLSEKQKANHRGSILQSWFSRSASRASTSSLDDRSPGYDENYDLLLSRLNENSGDLSALDDVTREQINTTHDTLKSSFAEKVSEDEKVDWSFWAEVVNDYASVAKSDPVKLSKELSAGIPAQIRGIVWQLVSNVNPQEFAESYPSLSADESKFEKNIQKDLSRTSFADDAQIDKDALLRVIRAYSNSDAECGYTQGMAFITVPLLMNMSELEAYAMLQKLMHNYNLRSLFLPEMPGLMLKMYQFDRLVEDMLPLLHTHFQRQGVRSSMYASQWFLTFFAYKFPLEIVLRIFDLVITEGVESILKFAIALVQKNEDKLLSLKFDDLLEFLKDHLFYAYLITPVDDEDEEEETETGFFKRAAPKPIAADTYAVDDLVEDATNVKILPITLKRYEEEWLEINREEKERREEIEELRLRNNQMKREIRKVEASYTILNREHVQIANEMIQGRMKIADLEDENKALKEQNDVLRARVKSLQNPITEDVPVPAALEEDLKNTMERNLEVMNKNQELEDQVQNLLQEIEELKAQLDATKSPSEPPQTPTPTKTSGGGLWGKKLFK